MKKIITPLLFFVSIFSFYGQSKSVYYEEYIQQYSSLAVDQMQKHKIPACIILAQGLLESGAGRSTLALKSNNHFGIKCHDWTGKSVSHDDDAKGECFRKYTHPRESYEDHSLFLTQRKRYASLFLLNIKDYKGWCYGLKAAGYATDPAYPEKLIRLIETYDLHQYDYTSEKKSPELKQEPEELPVVFERRIYKIGELFYIIAQKGDSFKAIAEEMGTSRYKLKKYNEYPAHYTLQEGDIIYLQKKEKRSADGTLLHTVASGETIHNIGQKYGIRVKSLYKVNNFQPDHRISVGDRIRLQ